VQFCCLGSGSKGNSTLINYKNTTLMVDCGFGLKHTLNRLIENDCPIQNISAILVTHEHYDHISGVSSLARRFNIPVYATRGTARTGKLEECADIHWIELDEVFQIKDFSINPVAVPHDANEPCQFVFEAGNKTLGVMTDLGSISAHVHQAFSACNALLLEANHDLDMLWAGKYPPSLKQRVSSDWGHLSNAQAEQFLHSLEFNGKLSTLVLGHMSQQNNCVDIVKKHFGVFEDSINNVVYATQDEGFKWLSV
jgi:phosphoribosyl 1,2-cyclic phosphodiesterase